MHLYSRTDQWWRLIHNTANVGQQIQQRRERDHDSLRLGCFARSQTLTVSGIPVGVSPLASPSTVADQTHPTASSER
jgi:hypothetical protein